MTFLMAITTLVSLIMVSIIFGILCDLIYKRNSVLVFDKLGSFFRNASIYLSLITGLVLATLVFSIPFMITI